MSNPPIYDPAGLMARAVQKQITEEDWAQRLLDSLVTVHQDGLVRMKLDEEYFVEKTTTLMAGIKKAVIQEERRRDGRWCSLCDVAEHGVF